LRRSGGKWKGGRTGVGGGREKIKMKKVWRMENGGSMEDFLMVVQGIKEEYHEE